MHKTAIDLKCFRPSWKLEAFFFVIAYCFDVQFEYNFKIEYYVNPLKVHSYV